MFCMTPFPGTRAGELGSKEWDLTPKNPSSFLLVTRLGFNSEDLSLRPQSLRLSGRSPLVSSRPYLRCLALPFPQEFGCNPKHLWALSDKQAFSSRPSASRNLYHGWFLKPGLRSHPGRPPRRSHAGSPAPSHRPARGSLVGGQH